jgi:hypothetical protein
VVSAFLKCHLFLRLLDKRTDCHFAAEACLSSAVALKPDAHSDSDSSSSFCFSISSLSASNARFSNHSSLSSASIYLMLNHCLQSFVQCLGFPQCRHVSGVLCFFCVASISIGVGTCGAGAFGGVKVVGYVGQEGGFVRDVGPKTLPTVFRNQFDLKLLWNHSLFGFHQPGWLHRTRLEGGHWRVCR